MKQLKRIELNIIGTPDELGVWQVKVSADLTVGIEEYPDWDTRRKGMVVILTPVEETAIKNFVKNTVLPQAELAK